MKKSLFVLVCVLGLMAAGMVSAQTIDLSYLQSLLNNLSGQVAQVSVGINRPSSVADLQTSIPGCRGTSGFSSTTGQPCSGNTIPTAVTTDRPVGNSVIPPVSSPPTPFPVGICNPGNLPVGGTYSTVSCVGGRWLSSQKLMNDGTRVGIGVPFLALENSNAALLVGEGSTHGINQETYSSTTGAPIKNHLGWLGLVAALTPTEALDLGGGNIKMGYEVVSSVFQQGPPTGQVMCPAGKKVISGGCSVAGAFGNGTPTMYTNSPISGGSGWNCSWSSSYPGLTFTGYAICANIR